MKNLYRDLVTTASKDAADNAVHVLHLTMPDVMAVIELIEALRELHDGNAEYSSINHLGAYKNHDMRRARNALYEVGGSFAPEDTWARTARPTPDEMFAPSIKLANKRTAREIVKGAAILESGIMSKGVQLGHDCHAECNCIRAAVDRTC